MRIVRSTVLFVTLIAAACGGSKASSGDTTTPPPPAEQKSLYDRLGGLDAIAAVIDDFIANVTADDRINARFANADGPRLRQMLIDQVCEATGGPCKYTGKSMIESHTGMNITEEEYDALVEDLVKSLEKLKVPEQEKTELLTAMGNMKGDIVGR
jgi:hemoglobin